MKKRKLLLVFSDILAILVSYFLALGFQVNDIMEDVDLKNIATYLGVIVIIKIFIFYFFRLYKSVWEYASIDEIVEVASAVVISNIFTILFMKLMDIDVHRNILLFVPMMEVLLIGGIRLFYRFLRRLRIHSRITNDEQEKILIVGAGAAGVLVLKELRNHYGHNSGNVFFVDDDKNKVGQNINGIPILGTRDSIEKICEEIRVGEIIIALPSAKSHEIKDIVRICKDTKVKTKILPGVYELIDEKVNIQSIRDVEISDLLGRKETELCMDSIYEYIEDRVVLITGGGGSIGSELSRQIVKFKPKKLILLDIYENNVYDIQNELLEKNEALDLEIIIASVRDEDRLDVLFQKYDIDIVFHAAAHKHVPLMEKNPIEAVKNNVFGTLNVAKAAGRYGIDKFVLISTDKAVNPTNVMGATKRIAELIIQCLNKEYSTDYVGVRFGNVLGSNGSVIPLFKKQIENGGPVTVTHKDVIRYFMTIPEACQLVLQAGSMANGGEIFILDMGEPVKILDLAKDLIRLSGFEPYVDVDIEITGLRPGEKLYEELLTDEDLVDKTSHEKIYIERPILYQTDRLKSNLSKLLDIVENENEADIIEFMRYIIPSYNPKEKKLSKINFGQKNELKKLDNVSAFYSKTSEETFTY